MADQTTDNVTNYVPGSTLGRSGYIEDPQERLSSRVRHLDALLCLITCSDHSVGEAPDGFFSLNQEIQRATLDLAASLSTEVHELHEEISARSLKQKMLSRTQSQRPN